MSAKTAKIGLNRCKSAKYSEKMENVYYAEVLQIVRSVLAVTPNERNWYFCIFCAFPENNEFPFSTLFVRDTKIRVGIAEFGVYISNDTGMIPISAASLPDEWAEVLLYSLQLLPRTVPLFECAFSDTPWLDVVAIKDGEEKLLEIGTVYATDNVVGIMVTDTGGNSVRVSSFYKTSTESAEVAIKDLKSVAEGMLMLAELLRVKITEKNTDYVEDIIVPPTEE